MKAKDFKQWDLFWNTNGYLTLVTSTIGSFVEVVNMNGSMYTLSKTSTKNYDTEEITPTVEEFLDKFPVEKLDWRQEKDKFLSIRDKYRIQQRKNKLLLIN